MSVGSDFNLLRNCSFNIATYVHVQIPKTDNWIAWFMGTYIFSKWCLKNPRKYECNHWNTRWWQDWGVVSLQGRGQFTLIVIWRFNETKSDPQLSQTTGAMTTELSRWRLAWWWFFHLSHTWATRKQNQLVEVLVFVQIVYARSLPLPLIYKLWQIVDANQVQFDILIQILEPFLWIVL